MINLQCSFHIYGMSICYLCEAAPIHLVKWENTSFGIKDHGFIVLPSDNVISLYLQEVLAALDDDEGQQSPYAAAAAIAFGSPKKKKSAGGGGGEGEGVER